MFNPSQYIVPSTEPKPVAQIPEEKGIHYIEAKNQFEPMEEGMGILQANDEWLNIDFLNVNEDETEWDPTPNEWQMIKEDDPLDYVTLPLLFMEYEQDVAHDRATPRPFGQPPENLENLSGNDEFCPQNYIINDLLPKPVVHIPNKPCVSIIQGLWENDNTVNLLVGGEEWTVRKAALEEGIIGVDLWACEIVEELGEALTATRLDKGKRKAETNLTDLYDDYVELWDEAYTKLVNHVTRSGRVYQPLNLQAGGPSHLIKNGLFNPVVQNNIHEEDVIQRQLAKILVAVSIWGLLSQSCAHRQKLIQMLSRMETAPETTPKDMVALLTPLLSKHAITFIEADVDTPIWPDDYFKSHLGDHPDDEWIQ
ncbi:hypothetical protein RHGRI_030931 [Rhododendron griersonianum]|uniref:Uncharacterized protein n=1 Tax=Rhododendron griersonianum TaxID=479676 RepID=A0AAV6I6E8_9ERIC|nr:hypothetical protein RHGRI_030931 [Rhododendron griersonianum]